jgi:3-hydroxybutyryl-CoA dehydratase
MSLLQRSRSLTFEQFQIGESVESGGRTITEADVVAFASLSGDWNRIHSDAEYARNTLFEQRVAHGLLTLSIASGLSMQMGFMEETVQAFTGMEWKFRAPVFIGDTIRMRTTIAKKREMRRLGGGFVTFRVEILKQDDTVVQKGTWQVLVEGDAPNEA